MSIIYSDKFDKKKMEQSVKELLGILEDSKLEVLKDPLPHLEYLVKQNRNLLCAIEQIEGVLRPLPELGRTVYDVDVMANYRSISDEAYERNRAALEIMDEFKK